MKPGRILTLLLLAVAFGVSAVAPVGAEQFVAVVITGDLPRYKEAHASFEKILRAGGMSEDKAKIFVQAPAPNAMSWTNSVRKAVGVDANLIITYGAPVTLVAKKLAGKIPILFADVYDPVALEVVKDLNFTGGEISGVAGSTPLESLVKTFTSIRPAKRIGILYADAEQGSALQAKQVEQLGDKFGYSVVKAVVANEADLDAALQQLSSVDGIYVSEGISILMDAQKIVDFATSKKIPVLSQSPGLGDMGALVNLETDPTEIGQLLGVHTIQVLNGQKAFSLPVRSPKKITLVVNQKAAARIGINVPASALIGARVIK